MLGSFVFERVDCPLHINKIVMDRSAFYESILARSHQARHYGLQPFSHNLGKNLSKTVDQAYRFKNQRD
jgi:hypothetical protein